jgi:hypothetical protein
MLNSSQLARIRIDVQCHPPSNNQAGNPLLPHCFQTQDDLAVIALKGSPVSNGLKEIRNQFFSFLQTTI